MESHIFRKDGIEHRCFCAECIATQGKKHGAYVGVPHTLFITRLCGIVVREDRIEEVAILLREFQKRIIQIGGIQLRDMLATTGAIQHVVSGRILWEQSFGHMLEHVLVVDEDRNFNDEYLKVGITFVFPALENVKDVVAWFQYRLKKMQLRLIPDAAMSLRKGISCKSGAAHRDPVSLPADAAEPHGL